MRFVLNTLRTLIVNQAIWHMHDKCYFNHKKYISFTGHDFTDMIFDTKQQNMVRPVQKM